MGDERNETTAADEKIGDLGARGEGSQDPALPFCGDLDMRIAADGTWFYKGTPIRRERLVKLFSTVLRREDDGQYWLVTPVERGRVVVEDAPFVAIELSVKGSGPEQVLAFRTNLDDWVEAGPQTPLRVDFDLESGEPRPYVLVREGLEARLLRNVYYHLVEAAEPRVIDRQERLGVWSKGRFFPLDRPETGP
ncbi:hypothetical protein SAMN06265365_11525 [Tistlia consotensis]|uniref:Proteophosphoglycan n=1 Tax=Tistlia consotensis USBA 355 TaxID=560819 RepID=A0A1Y6C5B1_9PROT|nr:DUF1285 domain-containing protein [Tistlia consotensis]SMF46547.1 hypothetical protein SAMN05428998_116109 [Tistlia consotensis USBA 355]SNR78265.1 hypothetical protein SAMN06265365_11525 [Tistlia consotensis]